ncbi:MAG: cell envelope integrity protein TolA, partial [Chromatiaceae bacterium]|nr:cell envelope integrity protein TolA [Chromatiaceae bacterium]
AEQEAQRQAEAKRKAEQEAQRQAEAKRKAEQEAQRQAEAKRKADEEARRQAEAQTRRREAEQTRAAEEARRAREEDLLAALDAEQESSALDSYVAAIDERIRQVWVRQRGMGRELSCLVEARLIPGGEVTPGSVRVIHSSGNPAFDRSVVAALYKASPLPVPSGRLFEQFRDLRFKFSP